MKYLLNEYWQFFLLNRLTNVSCRFQSTNIVLKMGSVHQCTCAAGGVWRLLCGSPVGGWGWSSILTDIQLYAPFHCSPPPQLHTHRRRERYSSLSKPHRSLNPSGQKKKNERLQNDKQPVKMVKFDFLGGPPSPPYNIRYFSFYLVYCVFVYKSKNHCGGKIYILDTSWVLITKC